MDKFWSIMTMPIGLLLCFGPAVFVSLVLESKNPPGDKKEDRH